MDKDRFFFNVLILLGTAGFIYCVGSFLTATFDISLWSYGQRLFAVIIYLLLIGRAFQSLIDSVKSSKPKEIENTERDEKAEVV